MLKNATATNLQNLVDLSDIASLWTSNRAWETALAPDLAAINIPGDNSTSETILPGQTVYETLEYASDSDWFQLDLAEDEAVSVELYGTNHNLGNGLGSLDVYNLTIYDSDGNVVAFNDYFNAGTSAFILFQAEAAGTYYVEVADLYDYYIGDYALTVTALTSYVPDYIPGDTTTTETISVGETRYESVDFIGDIDWFQVSLSADESVRISAVGYDHDTGNGLVPLEYADLNLYDSNGNLVASGQIVNWFADYLEDSLDYTPSSDGTYYIEVAGDYSSYAGDYELTVKALSFDDYIPGDETTTETLELIDFRNETLETAGDRDWFRMELNPYSTVYFDLYGSEHTAGNDVGWLDAPILRIYDADGNLILEEEPEFSAFVATPIDFMSFTGGTYYVEVAGVDDAYAGDYTISTYGTDTGAFGPKIAVGDVVKDALEGYNPPDYYHIDLEASDSVLFIAAGRAHFGGDQVGALNDPIIKIYNSKGKLVAMNDNRLLTDSLDSAFVFTPRKSGDFVIEVSSADGYSGEYVLLVDDVPDRVSPSPFDFGNRDAFEFRADNDPDMGSAGADLDGPDSSILAGTDWLVT